MWYDKNVELYREDVNPMERYYQPEIECAPVEKMKNSFVRCGMFMTMWNITEN